MVTVTQEAVRNESFLSINMEENQCPETIRPGSSGWPWLGCWGPAGVETAELELGLLIFENSEAHLLRYHVGGLGKCLSVIFHRGLEIAQKSLHLVVDYNFSRKDWWWLGRRSLIDFLMMGTCIFFSLLTPEAVFMSSQGTFFSEGFFFLFCF